MEFYKKNPCRFCRQKSCKEMECERWQLWFFESWNGLQKYAWEGVDRQGRREAECFRYELPHIHTSPCHGCVCESWCDIPCARRLNWWNDRITNKKL